MENKDTIQELEIMRQQMMALKDKLDSQEIVNDCLISNSMKEKMSWIKKYIIFEVGTLPLIALIWSVVVYYAGISWWNFIVLMVACVVDVIVDYRINIHGMKDEDYKKCNLIETTQKLMKMKHQRFVQMMISVPIVVVWLLGFMVEVYMKIPSTIGNDFMNGAFIGGLVGAGIGGVIGVWTSIKIYKKMQHTNDEVISQINEMVNGE